MKTSKIVINMLAIACVGLAGIAYADETTKEGYLVDSRGNVVKSGAGLCWHTSAWTPANAIAECDADLMKKSMPKIAQAPARAAAPVVEGEKAIAPPIILKSDALFDYNKSDIRSRGKARLDSEVVDKIKEYARVGVILVTGHADIIGSDAYNQKLSQRRADAVKSYLAGQGIAADRIETAAKGSFEPVVSCDAVKGKVNGKNKNLVECLQPNRRVVVEVKVQKPL